MPSHGKETDWKSTHRKPHYNVARQHLFKKSGREVGYSSSLIRLLQSRVRGRGLPCHTPVVVSSLAKKMVVHPLTNGRCRECLVWDVDETWRIEQPVWSEITVATAVLPWRAASNAYVHPNPSSSPQRGTRGLRHRCVNLLRGKTKSTRQTIHLLAASGRARGRRWSMAHCVHMPNSGVRRARARWD